MGPKWVIFFFISTEIFCSIDWGNFWPQPFTLINRFLSVQGDAASKPVRASASAANLVEQTYRRGGTSVTQDDTYPDSSKHSPRILITRTYSNDSPEGGSPLLKRNRPPANSSTTSNDSELTHLLLYSVNKFMDFLTTNMAAKLHYGILHYGILKKTVFETIQKCSVLANFENFENGKIWGILQIENYWTF